MKIFIKTAFSSIIIGFIALSAGCSKDEQESAAPDAPEPATPSAPDPRLSYLDRHDLEPLQQRELLEIAALYPEAEKTPSGLHYITVKAGEGIAPSIGDTVAAHYTGTLLSGQQFDSSRERGSPFRFAVGRGQVIPGWDEAFLSMKKGERRTLIIPSYLGYGKRRSGPIPPNATLIFDVELLEIE